jgi:hypothetical protein
MYENMKCHILEIEEKQQSQLDEMKRDHEEQLSAINNKVRNMVNAKDEIIRKLQEECDKLRERDRETEALLQDLNLNLS